MKIHRFALLEKLYTYPSDSSKTTIQDNLCKHFEDLPKKVLDKFMKEMISKEKKEGDPTQAYHCLPEIFLELTEEQQAVLIGLNQG